MITIRPGSPAALLVALIVAEREESKPSGSVKKRLGLTAELPARFRRPLIQRQAMRASEANA
jgi:hypothetical protein